MIAALTLVFIMPTENVKAHEKQSIEVLEVDLNDIIDVNYEIAKDITPINVAEVEISPGDSFKGVYCSEFSKDDNSLYTFDANNKSVETANRLYENNYFRQRQSNSNCTSIQNTKLANARKEYEEVGITTTVIQDLRI